MDVNRNSAQTRKKHLGAFYTPDSLSQILADWAIRSPSDTILEPSFGGCGFIDAGKRRLSSLGCKHPDRQIWGCDIDPEAFTHLSNSLGPVIIGYHQRFLLGDFLTTQGNSFSVRQFSTVLGNPPYVRAGNMSAEQKHAAECILEEWNFRSAPRASMWFFFLLQGLSFLKPGGRLAFVLPANFVKALYANDLLNLLQRRFHSCSLITIKDLLFKQQGTKEKVCLLLADGYSTTDIQNGKMELVSANNDDELIEVIYSNDRSVSDSNFVAKKDLSLLDDSEKTLVRQIANLSECHLLGEFCNVKIGFVTGNSSFFLLSKNQVSEMGFRSADCFDPVISSLKDVRGMTCTKNDYGSLLANDKKCLLLSGRKECQKSKRYRDYLASYPLDKIASNQTFARRATWFIADDGKIPDAYMTYMTMDCPRIVKNEAGLNATNTVHRVYFHDTCDDTMKMLISISLLSSFSRLHAELRAKNYGSGVLKIEPTDAKLLPLLLPKVSNKKAVNRVYRDMDLFLRRGDFGGATHAADEFIFGQLAGLRLDKVVPVLKAAVARFQLFRLQNK